MKMSEVDHHESCQNDGIMEMGGLEEMQIFLINVLPWTFLCSFYANQYFDANLSFKSKAKYHFFTRTIYI